MTFKRWHKIVLISLISLLVTTLLLRGAIARLAFSIVSERVESRSGVKSNYSKLKVRGINGIEITNLALYSDGHDTLFKSGHIYLRINPVKLLLVKADITYLELKGAALTFVKGDSTSNFDFLYKRSAANDTMVTRSNTVAYSATLDKALSLLLRILPSEANIDDFKISYRRGEYSLEITIPSLKLKDDTYTTEIETVENGKHERLKVNGILNDDERRISSKIVGCDESGNSKGRFSVPFLDFRWGARVMFDSLAFDFTAGQRRGGVLILNGSSLFSGISLFHKRVSLDTVYLKKAQFEYKTLVVNNFIELDSTSTATVNELTANPYLRAQKGEKWIVTASLNKEDFDSDQLLS